MVQNQKAENTADINWLKNEIIRLDEEKKRMDEREEREKKLLQDSERESKKLESM